MTTLGATAALTALLVTVADPAFVLFTVHGAMLRAGLPAQLAWFPVSAAGLLAALLVTPTTDVPALAVGALAAALLLVADAVTGGYRPYWAVFAMVGVRGPSAARTRSSTVQTVLASTLGVTLAAALGDDGVHALQARLVEYDVGAAVGLLVTVGVKLLAGRLAARSPAADAPVA